MSPRRLGAATGALLNQSHFRFCAVPKGLILRLGQILHRLKTNVPTIVDTQCGIWLCDSARRPVLSRFSFVFFIGVGGCVRSGVYRGGVSSSLVDSHTVVLAELTWVNLLAMRQPDGWNEFWATPPSGPHVLFCCANNPISVCLRRIVDLALSISRKFVG